jgi:hypothetical protein
MTTAGLAILYRAVSTVNPSNTGVVEMHEGQVIHNAMVKQGEAHARPYWDLGPAERKSITRSLLRRHAQPLSAYVIIANEQARHESDTTLPRAA